MLDPNYVESFQEFMNFIAVNNAYLTIGFTSLSVILMRREIVREYHLIKGDILPEKIDVSKIEKPKIAKISMSEKSLEQLAKNQYFESIKTFNDVVESNFNSEDLNNYYQNIRRVKIDSSKLLEKRRMKSHNIAGQYSSRDNKIQLVDPETIYHELFHMASTNTPKFIGFSQNGIGDALNEGYTEVMSHRYFPNYSYDSYIIQVEIVSQLERIVGKEKMEKLYLTSNLKGLIIELQKYASKEEIERFIANSDYALLLEKSMGYRNVGDKIVNKLMKNKGYIKRIRNLRKASNEIELFLQNCLEKKIIIDFKEKGHFEDMTEEEMLLLLKLRNIDMNDPINNNHLNKDLIDFNRHMITGTCSIMPEFDPLFSSIQATIGYEETYNAYIKNGFIGVLEEMGNYMTEEEINEIVNGYEYINNNINVASEFHKVSKQVKRLERLLISYDFRKVTVEEDMVGKDLTIERIVNIIDYYLHSVCSISYDVIQNKYCVDVESIDKATESLKDIYEEFSDNNVIAPTLEKIMSIPVEMIINNPQDVINICKSNSKQLIK